MASVSQTSGVVVWEWEERPSLWIPYGVDACQYLEKAFLELTQGSSKKTSTGSTVNLGNCSLGLSCYEVDLVNMLQLRLGTGTLRKIQRTVYPSGSAAGQGVRWEWFNDVTWVAYDIPTTEAIEQEYSAKRGFVDLSITPLAIPNYLDFHKKEQINKHTFFQRPVQRLTNQRYPLDTQGSSVTAKFPSKGLAASASFNGYTAFSHSRTSRARVTAGEGATAVSRGKKLKKVKVEHSQAAGATARDPLSEFCNDLETAPDEDCPICFEKLCNISSFDDESETTGEAQSSCIKQLTKCKHSFHASCLQAMYNSGAQDGSLQCPTCKAIHGVKHGNQPKDGVMDVHRSHRSLPGHPGCGMITIVYDFREGVQGPEHPNPGRRYSAGGFPRTCYLPDNRKGNKVLKLLKKAWQRRLIFTIGMSTTTGVQDTVIWNEIHHKTEAFSNHMGHGFPDPNYLDNVLAELAAQGVQDDEESENLQE